MAVVSCRVGSGRTASASSGRTSRVRSDASVSGRNGSHVFGARGRSAVRYVLYPPQRRSDSVHHVLCVSRHELFGLFVRGAATATKTNQNQIQHRSTYLPSNPASGRDRVSLATNTASPPRYPIHFFPNRPTRCAAVRSSSPSKRGDKFELSSGGKEGRGKTVSTAAVSPPDAEIGGACATTRTPPLFATTRIYPGACLEKNNSGGAGGGTRGTEPSLHPSGTRGTLDTHVVATETPRNAFHAYSAPPDHPIADRPPPPSLARPNRSRFFACFALGNAKYPTSLFLPQTNSSRFRIRQHRREFVEPGRPFR